MNFVAHVGSAVAAASDAYAYVPPQVQELAWRERQVAAIVYRFGYATAKDVELELHGSVSNGAIRSMLVRLTRKGLLKRRRGKRGAGCADVFIAALSVDHARRRALSKLADEFFGGSYSELRCFVSTSLAEESGRGARG
jgi:predicted transcriptional regulator